MRRTVENRMMNGSFTAKSYIIAEFPVEKGTFRKSSRGFTWL